MTILHFIPEETKVPEKKQRMSSLVCVIGEEKDYTKSEIDLLEEFAKRNLVWGDFLGKDKRKAQYTFFKKLADGRWYRRKESWSEANCVVPTLKEALITIYLANSMTLPDALKATVDSRPLIPPAVVRLREHLCLS